MHVVRLFLLALTLGVLALTPQPGHAEEAPRPLLLATTTSVQDSGLLDALLPTFTEETGIRVRSVAVGTGAALRMGREGNVDVLLTHAPSAEQALIEDGAIDVRVEIMQNYFALAGPASDPSGVRDAASLHAALLKLDADDAPFVSRGDDSGTHKREVALLKEAGLDPAGGRPHWTRTGSGMGLSLQVAGQKHAYILSDIGTFLAFAERTGLVVLSKPEPSLRNVYSVLRVSSARFPNMHRKEADAFLAWFQRTDVADRIAGFGIERYGRALFLPILGDEDAPSP
jgi:tungstate transport system substrate-binding protein